MKKITTFSWLISLNKRLSLIMPGVLPVMQKTTLAFWAQLNMKLMVGDLLKVFAVTAEQQ